MVSVTRMQKNELPLDKLKISYDQKLHYSTLQFHVPPELGRKLPGLPAPYDECGMIYVFIPDIKKENRCISSQKIDGDFSESFSLLSDYNTNCSLKYNSVFTVNGSGKCRATKDFGRSESLGSKSYH